MVTFTVIGFWPDTEQRFAAVVNAESAVEAECLCIQANPGVGICGVLAGQAQCVDASPFVRYDAEAFAAP